MTKFDFTEKRVLITGAQRGIGYAVAEAFCRSGAKVTILAETADVSESAAKLAKDYDCEVGAIQCDVTDRAAVARNVGGLGHLDILINNAGIGWATPTLDPSDKVETDFNAMMEVNILGTFYVTRSAAPNMSRGGKIVITSSLMGRHAIPTYSGYAASKHGVIGLTRALALDLGPKGINVNCICPGAVRTETAVAMGKDILSVINPSMAMQELSDEESIEIASMGTCIHKGLIEPDSIARVFLFLSSDAADDIHGQAINVDRGTYMS